MTFRRILRSARSRFSALQRAENSSMACVSAVVTNPTPFQCSSASRKFLNKTKPRTLKAARWCFSALQRAENSSIATAIAGAGGVHRRFQCSSASRKFLNVSRTGHLSVCVRVSVLFSEPKIPQSVAAAAAAIFAACFSALQRAENSSIVPLDQPNSGAICFSALQRAENSSIEATAIRARLLESFSALQRAENSSIPTLAPASIHISDRDDHASSFLSLPGASP